MKRTIAGCDFGAATEAIGEPGESWTGVFKDIEFNFEVIEFRVLLKRLGRFIGFIKGGVRGGTVPAFVWLLVDVMPKADWIWSRFLLGLLMGCVGKGRGACWLKTFKGCTDGSGISDSGLIMNIVDPGLDFIRNLASSKVEQIL